MKPIKILASLYFTALMAMAFVGASSAMAESTALCKVDAVTFSEEKCPEGELLKHVHERTLPNVEGKPSTKAELLSAIKILCDVLFLGDVTTANFLGSPLEIVGNFTYTNCATEESTACEFKELSAHAIVKVLKLGHELADVTFEYELNMHCGIFINCAYNGKGLEDHALGPLLANEPNGAVTLTEQTMNKVKGLGCPETAKLDITTTPMLTKAEVELAEAMGETFRSGATYIAK